MAVPVRKKSKAKKRSRRAPQDSISLAGVSVCENCGADVRSHHACRACGWYRDRVVLEMVDELEDEELAGEE